MGGYGTTSALTFNQNVHSEYLSVNGTSLLSSFTGGTISFTLVGSGTANLANVRDGAVFTLTLNFSESPSTGTLSASSVQLGGTIALYINPSSASYSHRVRWRRSASEYEDYTLGVGETSSTFYVPTYWSTGSATAILTTLNGGTQVGDTRSYSFTVTQSTTANPPTVSSFTVQEIKADTLPADWNVLVRGYSTVKLTATASATNATITSYRFVCGSQSATVSGNTWTSAPILDSGTVQCSVTVTDSNGNSTTKSQTISVFDYAPPIMSNMRALRCNADGTTSETGAYIKFSYALAYSDVGGRNSVLVTAQHRQIGAGVWSDAIQVAPNTETVIDAGLLPDARYEASFTAQDKVLVIVRTLDVTAGGYTMFFKRGGQNASIGIVGDREQALEINPDWGIFHGDVDLLQKILNALPATGGAMQGTIGSLTDGQVRNIMIASSVPTT